MDVDSREVEILQETTPFFFLDASKARISTRAKTIRDCISNFLTTTSFLRKNRIDLISSIKIPQAGRITLYSNILIYLEVAMRILCVDTSTQRALLILLDNGVPIKTLFLAGDRTLSSSLHIDFASFLSPEDLSSLSGILVRCPCCERES